VVLSSVAATCALRGSLSEKRLRTKSVLATAYCRGATP